MRLWKYELAVEDRVRCLMPSGAKVVAVGCQRPATVCLWALVEPDAEQVEREFRVAGTGHELGPGDWTYLGAAFDRHFVWHVLEAR